MSEHFPVTKSSGGKVKAELDLPNYEIKANLKKPTDSKMTHQSLLYRLI